MHEELLARALAEVEAILARAGLRQTAVTSPRGRHGGAGRRARVTAPPTSNSPAAAAPTWAHGIDAAAALRPEPSLVIVLTDGFTPWPDRPPPGVRVVVGLLIDDDFPNEWAPPPWARTIEIEEQTGR